MTGEAPEDAYEALAVIRPEYIFAIDAGRGEEVAQTWEKYVEDNGGAH